MARRLRWGIAMLILVSACGAAKAGNDIGVPSDGGALPQVDASGENAVPQSSFAAQLTRAACENLFECRLAYDDASQLRGGLGSVEHCEQVLAERVGDGVSTLFGRDITSLTFQPEQARVCLARFPHQCFAFEAEEPEDSLRTICAEVFDGDVAQSQTCMHDLACKGDAFCARADLFACEAGTCEARRGKGVACISDIQCSVVGAEGAVCTGTENEPGVCAQVTKVASVGDGERCGQLPSSEQAAVSFALCGDGLVCQREASFDMAHCAPIAALGAACDGVEECVPGAVCVPKTAGASTSVCASIKLASAGQACSAKEDGFSAESVTLCDRGLWCGPDRRCIAVILAAEGEPCEQVDCRAGLECHYDSDQDAELCAPLKQLGETCSSSSDCATDTCDFSRAPAICVENPCR